jgi:hypothetical protein
MPNHLFSQGHLRDALTHHAGDIEAEVAKAPEDHLLQADEDEWVDALVERYRVDVPELQREQWWMDEPAEITIDVRSDFSRAIIDYSRPALVAGVRVVVHVPFTGEADVFKFRPSAYTLNPPSGAEIRDGEVVVAVSYPADASRDVRAEAEGVLASIEKWLGNWAFFVEVAEF